MEKTIFAIYGVGGFAREVLPLLKRKVERNSNYEICFVLDAEYAVNFDELKGFKVISFDALKELKNSKIYLAIGFSDQYRRKEVHEYCEENGIAMLNLKADNVVIMNDVTIGEGHILCPFVTITSDVVIGKGFQANLYSYIAHDCRIGDYVTFAPAVKCNGNVMVGDNTYIGTGAIIYPGKNGNPLKIGKNVTIAAGSVVTKSIPDGMTVFGNPAIEFTRENIRRRK